ncbi:MAG: AAA family ATPase [Mucilaginibacter sp.]
MMTITKDFKEQVRTALLKRRPNFDGTDQMFAKSWSINGAVFSRIQKGQVDGVLADSHWIRIGRELEVGMHDRKWKTAATAVFLTIQEDILFCKEYAKAKIFVDECEIGKTHAARYISKDLRNCFYLDASQHKSKQRFVRAIAKILGVDQIGSYEAVKEDIKYYLRLIEKPIIIIDEAGDLKDDAFLELKEFWNATEGFCGWYMIGADGLKAKIQRGISNQKVGFRELFSRFSSVYSDIVPKDRNEKIIFYKELITEVLKANMVETDLIDDVLRKCITKDDRGNIGGLRRAESILILNS